MENTRDSHEIPRRSVAWLPEMDRILTVGMKYGPRGIREATQKVLALRTGLTRADCWKRLRILRENSNRSGLYPAPHNWPIEVKELLREGYRQGGRRKREAIKAVRTIYPGLPSNAPSRFARREGWLVASAQAGARRSWTEYEDRKLWELAGYETAAKIGERLGRSENAVRFRLKSLGLSVKVKDGWSFRVLQEMLHVGPSKLRRFIADGSLRVRDPRITSTSLAAFLDRRNPDEAPQSGSPPEANRKQVSTRNKAYSWGTAAKLLRADVAQIRKWIVEGELRIADGFVTERAFQDFCKRNGSELNCALLGSEVRDWLAEGYSLNAIVEDSGNIPGRQKHALIARRCPLCKQVFHGNIYFRHIKNCKQEMLRAAVTVRAS